MNSQPHQKTLFILSILMVATIPWYASGKSAFPLLILELLGASQLLILTASHSRSIVYGLDSFVWFFLFLLILFTTVFLLPLTTEVWKLLPGRLNYQPAISWLANNETNSTLSLSLIHNRTVSSLILLIALVSLFISTSLQSFSNKKKILSLILLIACIQGVWGAIQFSTNNPQWYPFNSGHSNINAIGTYLNRDHFVFLAYMTLPIAILMLGESYLSIRKNSNKNQYALIKTIGLSLAIIILICSAFFSRSRAGISLTVLATIAATLILTRQSGSWRQLGIIAIIIASSLATAISTGILSTLNRFIILNPFEDGRWEIFHYTLEGIKMFWPLGSGVGTFQEIYATIQPFTQKNFINHVHNDYLELLFEMGVAGAIILTLALIIYIKSWLKASKEKNINIKTTRMIVGLSLLLSALHGLVDFNLHTPANQVIFVVFCAVFISETKESGS